MDQRKLCFLIVDDDENKAEDMGFSAHLLSPARIITITEGEFAEEVLTALEQIYSEGQIPFLILDENLGSEIVGSKIFKESILTKYAEEGGIVMSGSLKRETQDYLIGEILDNQQVRHNWILSSASRSLDEEEIVSDLQRFFDLHNDEPNVELKNN